MQSRLDNEAFIEKETWMIQAVPLPSCSLPPSVFLIPGSATVCAFSLIFVYVELLIKSTTVSVNFPLILHFVPSGTQEPLHVYT